MELILLTLTFLGTVAGLLSAFKSTDELLVEIRDLLREIRDALH